jgi:hypothetical protein
MMAYQKQLSTSAKIVIGVVVVLVITAIVLLCVFLIPRSPTVTPTSTHTPPAPPPVPPTPPNGGINMLEQPESTVQIVNGTSQNPLVVSMQLDSNHQTAVWSKSSGSGTIGAAVFGDNTQNPPNYQLVSLGLNEAIILNMPNYTAPWRITPLSANIGKTEMPILVEGNKSLVLDMSAVDGVNYLLKMELTASEDNVPTIIDFNTSPCDTPGQGCFNPYVDGLFIAGKNAFSDPCALGTCNLDGKSRTWAEKINTGQCSNVDSTWASNSFAEGCMTNPRGYTTYSYSHSDRNSSPTLVGKFLVKLQYSDL